MTKSAASIIWGAPIFLVLCLIALCLCDPSPSRGEMYISGRDIGALGLLLLYSINGGIGIIVIALLTIGLVLGIQGLKSEPSKKPTAITGIAVNSIGLLVGICVLLPPMIDSVRTNMRLNIVLSEGKTIQGITFPKGTKVSYNSTGKLLVADLVADQKIQNIIFPKGTKVIFNKSGLIDSVCLGRDSTIQGIFLPKDTGVFFYPSGKIRAILSDKSFKMNNIDFPTRTILNLDELGRLQTAVLWEDAEIRGKQYKKNQHIKFDEKSNIIEAKY